MTARARAGLAVATLAAATLLACGDPNAPRANFRNYADTLELHALNGSPRAAPTAVSLVAGLGGSAAVRTTEAFRFDVAVDLDAENRPVLYPVRVVAASFLGRHRVGLQPTDRPFDSITEAPTSGYTHDSLTVATIGKAVLIETADPEACATPFGSGVIYGKMIVDSIRIATRRLFVRVTGNPNCGFRSFEPGRPTR